MMENYFYVSVWSYLLKILKVIIDLPSVREMEPSKASNPLKKDWIQNITSPDKSIAFLGAFIQLRLGTSHMPQVDVPSLMKANRKSHLCFLAIQASRVIGEVA